MTTPEDWRREASAKAIGIIAEGAAVFQHLNLLGDRINVESQNLERARRTLDQHRIAQATTARTSRHDEHPVDALGRAESDVKNFETRLAALIAARDAVTAEKGAVLKLGAAAKELSKKFDLEAH